MEALTHLPVQRPAFKLIYEGRDITVHLETMWSSLTYTDKLAGEADEIEIRLEDTDGHWIGDWMPRKGDRVQLALGYAGAPLLPCGWFEVDEVTTEGPPAEVSIKAISAAISQSLRTRNSRAYETTTLAALARQVAAAHGLTVVGDIDPIPLQRVTQNQETDLAFLHRQALRFGHLMSVRDQQLYFSRHEQVLERSTVLTVRRDQLKRWSLRDKTAGVFRSVSVSYLDPKTNKLQEHTESDKALKDDAHADTLKLTERAENLTQARAMALAALRNKNLQAVEGELTLIGDTRVLAGNNLDLVGMGGLSGKYQVRESRHTITRNTGYEVAAQVQRISTPTQ